MSVTYGFYNALNHDRRYDAIQMSQIFDGIINDGVYMSIGEQLMVKENQGMYVSVKSGRAWFNHTWTLNTTDYVLEVPRSEIMLDRIDAVVLEVDSREEVRANAIKIVKGNPSDSPQPPAYINTDEVHQHPLAEIRVRAEATSIRQADITNKVGTGQTPFVTGIIETIDIDDLVLQWQSQWNDWKSRNTEEFERWYDENTREFDTWTDEKKLEYEVWTQTAKDEFVTWSDENKAEFIAWFETLQYVLDGDVAGHLQNEINDIYRRISGQAELYNECDTPRSVLEKTLVIEEYEPEPGSTTWIKFTDTSSTPPPAGNITLNINDTGAKNILLAGVGMTPVQATNQNDLYFYNNSLVELIYDGNNWLLYLGRDYDTQYTNSALGQGFGTCSTAEGTTAKIVNLTNYELVTGGIVAVRFTYNVPANSSLNINNKGAKYIYYKDTNIKANVINAGDVATFIYDGSNYILISVDTLLMERTYQVNLTTSGWSGNTYSFESTYPSSIYNISVEPNGSTITDAQLEAWNNANMLGSNSNVLIAKGDKPTVNIPVLVKVVRHNVIS